MSNVIDQQIFDTCAVHLIRQGSSSTDDTGLCRYRGGNGYKCAVGCLITDDLYTPELETNLVETAIVMHAVCDSLGIQPNELNIPLLRELQAIHDIEPPSDWNAWLTRLAHNMKLNTDKMRAAWDIIREENNLAEDDSLWEDQHDDE